eukprot:12112112-Alexandrium_andersonii.AAC.1
MRRGRDRENKENEHRKTTTMETTRNRMRHRKRQRTMKRKKHIIIERQRHTNYKYTRADGTASEGHRDALTQPNMKATTVHPGCAPVPMAVASSTAVRDEEHALNRGRFNCGNPLHAASLARLPRAVASRSPPSAVPAGSAWLEHHACRAYATAREWIVRSSCTQH